MTSSNPTANTPAMLRLDGVTRRFGEFTAVDDVSFDIESGEFITLLGPSGSGKSTTLYMIAGFDNPSAGDIRIGVHSVIGVSPNERNVGMVFQRYSLFPHMNVAENVGFPLSVRKRARADIDDRVAATLRQVQLSDFAHRKPSELSGGQQQRVALARALVYEPSILLMDEPLSALDRKLREELQNEIRALHKRVGATIVYVTHDQEEALRMSDRIAVFNHGQIIQVGSGEDLYRRPADSFVASFIGGSTFLTGTVDAVNGRAATVALPNDKAILRAPKADGLKRGDPLLLMIRPESAQVNSDRPDDDNINYLEARIQETVFLGDNITYSAVTDQGREIRIKEHIDGSKRVTPSVGDRCYISWSIDETHAFKDWNDVDIGEQLGG